MKKCINDLFEKQVIQTPDNIAIVDDNKQITYKELNEKINQFTDYLIKRGLKKDDRVCIVMNHSIEMIITIFAVIKSGATYIPMEPTFPINRINYIVEEAEAKYIITQEEYKNIFIKKEKIIIYNQGLFEKNIKDNPTLIPDEDTILYVLYTSGTTGNPKGVMVQHKNVYNYINAFKDYFKINENDRMLHCSVCTFDIFVEEVYPILMTGGTLIIASMEILNNTEELFNLIKTKNISITSTFPYFLNDIDKKIKSANELPDSWRIAISGGDTLRKEFIEKISKKIRVFNTYGPTETTVCATYYEYDSNSDLECIPVGKPINNVKVYILDDNLDIVKDGTIGEICISGNGVSKGYLNLAEKTNENFITNPFDSKEKMYKTGDLGRVLLDGNIEFIKRKDQQVMIWGKRVEPLEVEKVMLKNNKIKNAIVKAYQDEENYSHLVAYLIFNDGKEEKISTIKKQMEQYIPNFMIPETFIKMPQFPLTINGKIDRKSLPMIMR